MLKRLLIHTGGFNLGLLMRQLIGVGTPRRPQGRLSAVLATLLVLTRSLCALVTPHRGLDDTFRRPSSARSQKSLWCSSAREGWFSPRAATVIAQLARFRERMLVRR
jgi:hypothetical protein